MSTFGISRLALVTSAAALVLAACSQGADDQIAAPGSKAISSPKVKADFGTASAGLVQVCIGPNMPTGPYSVSFTDPTAFEANDAPNYDPADNYTHKDVKQATPQTLTGGTPAGECKLLFTKNRGIWDPNLENGHGGFGAWVRSFTTMTITNTNSAQVGGTYTFTCESNNSGPPALCPAASGSGAVVTSGGNPDHGSTVVFSYTVPIESVCDLGYPDASNMPMSGRAFNESEVLAAAQSVGGEVRAWYTDEHAMLLGERQIILKLPPAQGGTMTFNHTFTAMTTSPSTFTGPGLVNVGPTILSGDGAAIDPYGRPLFPAVFITDLNLHPGGRNGDWQQGGTPYRPNKIFGTWKAVVATVNYTKTPTVTTFATDNNPAKNNLNFGPGSNAPPGAIANPGYGTEIVWNLQAALGGAYNASHNYRLQFMVHDGDQNKSGGDVGQACMNIGPDIADRSVIF